MKKLILTGCLVLFSFGVVLASEGQAESRNTRACATKGVQSLLTFPWPNVECPGCE